MSTESKQSNIEVNSSSLFKLFPNNLIVSTYTELTEWIIEGELEQVITVLMYTFYKVKCSFQIFLSIIQRVANLSVNIVNDRQCVFV